VTSRLLLAKKCPARAGQGGQAIACEKYVERRRRISSPCLTFIEARAGDGVQIVTERFASGGDAADRALVLIPRRSKLPWAPCNPVRPSQRRLWETTQDVRESELQGV